MKFNFTHHAQERMLLRKVTSEMVKFIINNPIHKEYQDGQTVVKGIVQGRTLRVVYRYEKSTHVIITTYYED